MYVSCMKAVERIVTLFGGYAALARELDIKHASTVQGWVLRGRVPHWWVQPIIEAGIKRGHDLKHEDFFDSSPAKGEAA